MAKRARKPVRKPAPRSTRTAASTPQTHREKIVAAFLALLGDKPFAAIGFDDVAHRSGLSLAQVQDIDDMTEEPARERLFDVLMRRLEVLAEQRNAVRSLLRSARSNPPLALALNRLAVRSCSPLFCARGWMTAAPAKRGRWSLLTGHLPAVSALSACLTICAPSPAAFAGCDRAGGGARAAILRKPRPPKFWQFGQICRCRHGPPVAALRSKETLKPQR